MPPRTRKTAAAEAAPAPATLDATESVPADAQADGAASEADGQEQAEPATALAPVADGPAPVEPSAAEAAPASDAPEPTAPAFHWETPAGALGDPCRLCHSGGPLETAGSIGCHHGQWVRVWDAV